MTDCRDKTEIIVMTCSDQWSHNANIKEWTDADKQVIIEHLSLYSKQFVGSGRMPLEKYD